MLIPVDTYIVMFLFNHIAREKDKRAWNALWQTECPFITIQELKLQNYYKVVFIAFGPKIHLRKSTVWHGVRMTSVMR